MADTRELLVTLNLSDDLSDVELAELRWHLGLAPQPPELAFSPGLSPVTELFEDEDGNLVPGPPQAIFGEPGPGYHIGGALVSSLVRREGRGRTGWALTIRQEIHPDSDHDVDELLVWLASRADLPCTACKAGNCAVGCEFFAGFRRFYEEADIEAGLIIKGGRIGWSTRSHGFDPIELNPDQEE